MNTNLVEQVIWYVESHYTEALTLDQIAAVANVSRYHSSKENQQMTTNMSTKRYTIKSLDASTWDQFAELVERNNGIYGGCWCIGFHPECGQKGISHRDVKEERVRTGRAHHALVVDEEGMAQGWCQWGDTEELSKIKHRRAYDKQPPPLPDWRIACIFVDKKHRGQGIARMALAGALQQIAAQGGGHVEAISEVTSGRKAQGHFLFSGTVELLEEFGFQRVRQVGKHAWIVSKHVLPG